jgi:hypothetical protein
MTKEQQAQLVDALRRVLGYVMTSYDPMTVLAVNVPMAQRLRNEADQLEKKDRDIEFARNLLREIESQPKDDSDLRVGDEVMIRNDLTNADLERIDHEVGFPPTMRTLLGVKGIVTSITSNGAYNVEFGNQDWNWPRFALVKV